MSDLRISGIPLDREIVGGDPLPEILHQAAAARGIVWESKDILVVAQKIVSKWERQLVDLRTIRPSRTARDWAARFDRDARQVEVVLREAVRIVRMEKGVIITETRHGFVCANCGVDRSNTPPHHVTLLPEDPDRSAAALCTQLEKLTSLRIACIVSDSFGRPWREGLVDVAIGVSGLKPILDLRGRRDRLNRPLQSTVLAVADQLAAAAGLVMGKDQGIPAVLVRGYLFETAEESCRLLVRSVGTDLFR